MYQTKHEPLLEYKLAPLTMSQVKLFISKTITRNKIAINRGELKEEKVKQLKDFLNIDHYMSIIEELSLLSIMRNPWMLKVVITSLPTLKSSDMLSQQEIITE